MEYSDRGRYVTHLVTTWIENDGDHVELARKMALIGPESLGLHLTEVLRRARHGSAPWQAAQDLAPNDYGRVDWARIAEDLIDEEPDREPTREQERAWDAREDDARGSVTE